MGTLFDFNPFSMYQNWHFGTIFARCWKSSLFRPIFGPFCGRGEAIFLEIFSSKKLTKMPLFIFSSRPKKKIQGLVLGEGIYKAHPTTATRHEESQQTNTKGTFFAQKCQDTRKCEGLSLEYSAHSPWALTQQPPDWNTALPYRRCCPAHETPLPALESEGKGPNVKMLS